MLRLWISATESFRTTIFEFEVDRVERSIMNFNRAWYNEVPFYIYLVRVMVWPMSSNVINLRLWDSWILNSVVMKVAKREFHTLQTHMAITFCPRVRAKFWYLFNFSEYIYFPHLGGKIGVWFVRELEVTKLRFVCCRNFLTPGGPRWAIVLFAK